MKISNETKTDAIIEKKKQWPQILAVFTAAISSFSAATLFNWTSPSIPILLSDAYDGIDLEESSYLTVSPPIATIIASPIYGICVEKFGRKYTLLSLGVFHLLAWIFIAIAKTIYLFHVSRIIFGIADAAMFGVLPIYIAEVTTPEIRGSWGNAMAFFIYIGQFAINVVGYFFDIQTTAFIFMSVPIIFIVLFMLMPETPYYLVMKRNCEGAKRSLRQLRRVKDVESEFDQLKSDVERQMSEPGTYKDAFCIQSNRKAILIVAWARGVQQLSGISAFAVYTQYIFQQSGQNLNQGYSAMIYTGILAASNLCGSIFVDRLGRKLSMSISGFGCSIILLSQAVYFFLKDNRLVDLSPITWFPVAAMVVYVLSFSVGLGLVPTVLLGELFSTSIRGKASCIMTVVFSLYIASISKLFQYLASNFGLHAPFALFALCSFFSSILSYYLIPETKGKTLEEIQQILKGNKK